MRSTNREKQEEIDIVEMLRSLWNRRGFIAKVTGAALLSGLLLAIFGEVKYTALSVVVPQTGQRAAGGGLQGLAAMAGINLNSADQAELLPPMIYPMVVGSVPFQKELMYSEVTVSGHGEPVKLLDYFTERGYRKFSLFPFLYRYTLGLPGLVMGAIGGGGGELEAQTPAFPDGIETLSAKENECMKLLSKRVVVTVNEQNGYISLSATMPQALMAAQVAARAQKMLQDYITRFKVQKEQESLDFINERYLEVKADFEAKQRALATYRDANRNVSSELALTRESSLENEYDLAFSIYSEMARGREQANIKVKEDTPIFTVVEPVTVPLRRSAPRRVLITGVSLFLGLVAGAGLSLAMPWIKNSFKQV
jgi:uncharacterized protein involved in exopolysaccharide biosynthesis